MSNATITIRRAAQRAHTQIEWLDSRHSFNFGPHHTPGEDGFGLLLVNNDDRITPGAGFGAHPHQNMEIVTWVLDGTLAHRDSAGHSGLLYPGLAQRMSAGTGIHHSEMNGSVDEPAHFIQMWVLPDQRGVEPGYEQADRNDALAAGGLVPIASGQGHEGAVSIHQAGAVLWGGRLQPGETVDVPVDAYVHVFPALGSGTLTVTSTSSSTGTAATEELATGDAARLRDPQAATFTAGPDGAELLVWQMQA